MAWYWQFKDGSGIQRGNGPLKKCLSKTTLFFILVIMIISGYFFFLHTPFKIQAKPQAVSQKNYDYYVIVDKNTNFLLMYVPVTVRIGDELISDNNNRYVVVEVIDDVAYAQFVENIPLR